MWKAILNQVLSTQTSWRQYYKKHGFHLDRLESLQTLEEFNELPVLRKSQLPQLQKEKLPFAGFVQYENVSRIFVSPGPIYDPQGKKEDFWNFSPLLSILGVNEQDILQNTFSYHLSPLGFMLDEAGIALGAKVIPAGTGNSEIQVEVLKDLQTTVLIGTPSFIMHLVRLAEQKDYQLGRDLALCKAFFTAEKLTEEMKEFFAEREIEYIEAYGTADLGCIAYRKKGEHSFTLLEHVFVQICDPVTGQEVAEGELGEVVISMASDVYPLVRFGTGDLSRWVIYQQQLEGLLGRVGDSYKVKGMFVHAHQLGEAMKLIPEVTYYQAEIHHQDGKDLFVVKVEVGDAPIVTLTAELIERWENQLQSWLRVRPTVEIVTPQSISREEKQLLDLRK